MTIKLTEENKPLNWQELVLNLKSVAEKKDISNYAISKATGYSESTISRIFKLSFCPQLKIYLDIASFLNVSINIENDII